ncbi:hypothetical protein B0J14DRAFT_690105 [Halenospora varia]|nr:hypothetical protein B0J14DRAFT_690105 [Halenospora varia]
MTSYGANGVCGWQHDNKTCLPLTVHSCCSINGFCGSDESFCFTRYGCQSSCVDPPAFYLTTTPSSTTAPTVTSTTTATPLPVVTPTLTTLQKTGVIIGSILGGVLLVAILLLFLHYRRKTPNADRRMIRFTRTDMHGNIDALEMPENFAKANPQIIRAMSPAAFGGPAAGRRAIGNSPLGSGGLGLPAGNTARYMDDASDFRMADDSGR